MLSFIMPRQTKMDKKIIISATAAIVMAISGHPHAAGQSPWISNDTLAHNLVWEDKLYRQVEFLSDSLCGGRATGSAGGNEAAFWIIRNFRESGLMSPGPGYGRHIYSGEGTVGHNIIGMIPGSLKTPCDSYIVVGAHYDHLGILAGKMYPGADSNASGTAALVTLARMFTSMKTLGKTYGKNIIFVAFDGQCMNLSGSYSFWRMIEDGDLEDPVTGETVTKDRISLMVNIDQIGCTLSPLASGRKDYMIMLGNDSLKKEDRNKIGQCNLFYGTGLEISHSYYGSKDFTRIFYTLSDQKVFIENGVPAVLFTSGITMNNNKTYDTADTLDYEILRKRIILIFHWIEKML